MSRKVELNKPMRAAIDDQTIRGLVAKAERREAAHLGVKLPFARAALAREWKVSEWTLANLRRGRLKDLRTEIRGRIKAGIIRVIEREIQRLEHELIVARQCGAELSEAKISQAFAALEQAREFLEGK